MEAFVPFIEIIEYYIMGNKQKYPIGTRIKYNGILQEDVGKEGTIVGHEGTDEVWVIIPNSHIALKLYGNPGFRWLTYTDSVELLVVLNQQLLFNFMNEVT